MRKNFIVRAQCRHGSSWPAHTTQCRQPRERRIVQQSQQPGRIYNLYLPLDASRTSVLRLCCSELSGICGRRSSGYQPNSWLSIMTEPRLSGTETEKVFLAHHVLIGELLGMARYYGVDLSNNGKEYWLLAAVQAAVLAPVFAPWVQQDVAGQPVFKHTECVHSFLCGNCMCECLA